MNLPHVLHEGLKTDNSVYSRAKDNKRNKKQHVKQQHCQQLAQTEGNRQHNNRKKGKTTKRKSHVLLIWKTLPREKKT